VNRAPQISGPHIFGRPFVWDLLSCLSVTLDRWCIVANGWMDQYATWYGARPRPRRHWDRWGPSSLPRKGAQQPPMFGPCLLWPHGCPSQQLLSSCFLFVITNQLKNMCFMFRTRPVQFFCGDVNVLMGVQMAAIINRRRTDTLRRPQQRYCGTINSEITAAVYNLARTVRQSKRRHMWTL